MFYTKESCVQGLNMIFGASNAINRNERRPMNTICTVHYYHCSGSTKIIRLVKELIQTIVRSDIPIRFSPYRCTHDKMDLYVWLDDADRAKINSVLYSSNLDAYLDKVENWEELL